jgi:hypothetical protein
MVPTALRSARFAQAKYVYMHSSHIHIASMVRSNVVQRIRSMRYSSFSVLGLSLIVTFGTVLIVLDLSLEGILSWWDQKRHRDPYQRLEWQSNEILQLQRLAHEAYGAGTWERVNHHVPVTDCKDRLAVLDTSNVKHPRFKGPEIVGVPGLDVNPGYAMSMDQSMRSKTGFSSGSSPEIQQTP